ncbi:YciI family protein [Rhodoblastus sp.]|uniref:YciI family protein n=1 Tax=Rhodoblastus sp. TaxID=1962975 RepID=UPI003F94F1B9
MNRPTDTNLWKTLMHFVALCFDKPDSLAIRQENRAAHLAFLAENAAAVKLGGPFLDSAGQMCGSMLIFSCTDEAAARALLAGDPYGKAGLFALVELRAYRPVVGVWLA